MLIDLPIPGLVAEGGEHKFRLLKGAIAIAPRGPHTGVAESDYVGISTARQVGEKSWVLIDLPIPGLVAEGGEHKFRLLKGAVAIAQRGPYTGVAESDYVRTAIACQIDNKPRMHVDPPSPGLVAQTGDDDVRLLKAAVAVAECSPHSAISETDDVIMAARGQAGEEPGVFLDAPSQRDGDIDDAPASQGTGDIELVRRRLRPRQLFKVLAAVTGGPEVRVGACIQRLSVG